MKLASALLAISVGFSLLAVPTASTQPVEFIILHTNSVNGHLFGCPT